MCIRLVFLALLLCVGAGSWGCSDDDETLVTQGSDRADTDFRDADEVDVDASVLDVNTEDVLGEGDTQREDTVSDAVLDDVEVDASDVEDEDILDRDARGGLDIEEDVPPDVAPDTALDVQECIPQPEVCDGVDNNCNELIDDLTLEELELCGSLANALPIGCGSGVCRYLCDSGFYDANGDLDVPATSDGCECAASNPIFCDDVPRPEAPLPIERIHHLSFTLRTADVPFAGTDDGLEFCINDTDCFRLGLPDYDDFQRGATTVYTFDDLDLPSEALENFTIRTTSTSSDNDAYRPACASLRANGQPMYCREIEDVVIGTGDSAQERASWSDPNGLENHCLTCEGDVLTHAPLLGLSTPTEIRVQARADATRLMALELATSPLGGNATVVAWDYPKAEHDFTTTFQVGGLDTESTYWYRVVVEGGEEQPWRPVSTAPNENTPIKIAMGSCARDPEQPIFGKLAEEELQAFIFLGDNHYANADHIDTLNQAYRDSRADIFRGEFVSRVPILSTWDDHDFLGNNSDGGCGGGEKARRAFQNYWANPSYGSEESGGVYTRARYGPVEIFLADCRSFRPYNEDAEPNCAVRDAELSDDGTGLLGQDQTTWLLNALEESDATFKLLGCGSGFLASRSEDAWHAFSDGREALFRSLVERRIEGVVLMSGDVHRSELWRQSRPDSYTLFELVSSPLSYYQLLNDPVRNTCMNSPDRTRTFCYPWDSYITVEVFPNEQNPRLVATVKDEQGGILETLEILRSELTLP